MTTDVVPEGWVFRRPAREGACRSGTGCCAAARWIPTARQLQPRSCPEREPWGTVHVRREGDLLTACGEYAVDWYSLFNRDFELLAVDSCRACARVLSVLGHGPTRHRFGVAGFPVDPGGSVDETPTQR